jgi:uncharacterized small protein (DUF1192 family)
VSTEEPRNALVDWYADRFGDPASAAEAYGYWLSIAGVVLTVLGAGLVVATTETTIARGVAIAVAQLGVAFVLAGLSVRSVGGGWTGRLATVGLVVSVLGVAWLVVAYPGGRILGRQSSINAVLLYATGVVFTLLAGTIGPVLVGRPAETSTGEPPVDPTSDGDEPVEEPLDAADAGVEELRARIDLLEGENRRLREEYARARRSQYRRTAIALFLVGAVALGAGALFPAVRNVLIAVGSVGVFAAILTVYLTPERFVPASVGERVYAAHADAGAAVVADLGLTDARVYVPADDGADPETPARLFVPQHVGYEIPGADALDRPFVVTDDERGRGVALAPTGGALFAEFERALAGPLAEQPGGLADQLADALVEQFELVATARPEVAADEGRVTVGLSGSTYGGVDRFDHPVGSFLAVGFAVGLDQPVTASVATGDDRSDYLVTVEWAVNDGDDVS